MNKFEEVKALGESIMEGADDILRSMCKTSFGTLEQISSMDNETFMLIKKTLELMERSKSYVRVTSEAFLEMSGKVEDNNRLLQVIKTQLALLIEKK